MKQSHIFPIVAASCLSLGAARAASPQAGTSPMGTSLAGTWTLTAADTLYPDGHRARGFGDRPQGRMMVDTDGRYMIEIYQVNAIPTASGARPAGMAAPASGSVSGPVPVPGAKPHYSVHYGRVTLDPATHHIVFDVERSVTPSWEGRRQVRDYTLEGNRLSYRVTATGDGTIALSEWMRSPD